MSNRPGCDCTEYTCADCGRGGNATIDEAHERDEGAFVRTLGEPHLHLCRDRSAGSACHRRKLSRL